MTYVLLTRAPLYWGRSPFSLDLHVLGAPLTFVLSQDQTLQLNPVLAEVSGGFGLGTDRPPRHRLPPTPLGAVDPVHWTIRLMRHRILRREHFSANALCSLSPRQTIKAEGDRDPRYLSRE